MDGVLTGPNWTDWTRWSRECTSSLHPVSVRTLAASLGAREVADLLAWGAALNVVGADVAEQCRTPWPHTSETPVVVLLRSIGEMAREHPDASTLLGEALLVMIEATEGQRRAELSS